MEQFKHIQEQVNQLVDSRQLDFLTGGDAAVSLGAAAAAIVVGILICFFGLKLVKFLGALIGFFLGAAIGGVIALVAGLEGLVFAGVVIVGGFILGILSWFIYRIGVFFLVLAQVFSIGIAFLQPSSSILLVVVLAVALVLAILAVIFVEPFVMVVSGLAGGLAAGTNIGLLAGFADNGWIGVGIGAVIAVAGIIVQFMMHSRKVGKKEKNYSKKVKELDSMESEVEKARHLLDDDEDDDLQDED